MSTATTSSSSGIGFSGLLTVVFITLKLTHVIAWSWLWVLAPIWIGFAVWMALFAAILLAAIIAGVLS